MDLTQTRGRRLRYLALLALAYFFAHPGTATVQAFGPCTEICAWNASCTSQCWVEDNIVITCGEYGVCYDPGYNWCGNGRCEAGENDPNNWCTADCGQMGSYCGYCTPGGSECDPDAICSVGGCCLNNPPPGGPGPGAGCTTNNDCAPWVCYQNGCWPDNWPH